MASPIGHALAGYAVQGLAPEGHRGRLPIVALAVVMANAPDLDFLPGLAAGTPALYHQGPTHSLAFAVAASALVALALRLGGYSFRVTFAVGCLAYGSHLLLDALGADRRLPYGLPLAWPFAAGYVQAPVAVLPGFHHAASTAASTLEWLDGVLDPVNLRAIALEVLLVGPAALWARRRQRRRAAPGAARLLGALPPRLSMKEDSQP